MSLANTAFPDGYSVLGEERTGCDAVGYGGLLCHLLLTLRPGAFASMGLGVDIAR
ncbi:hypothetical protein OV208_06230 [Corallococcus sp. bb12-1]|uniref:hypothetical protein n=1 Tax=Corallococcus sp. bb12-1 TaxID=2996784 RepID=UPI002271E9E4|nr:hypothetical protein [Corallococcus sp. bb12-1]MCY1040915.1 hypothetical protein [Corallococcus sp. bb12-1]